MFSIRGGGGPRKGASHASVCFSPAFFKSDARVMVSLDENRTAENIQLGIWFDLVESNIMEWNGMESRGCRSLLMRERGKYCWPIAIRGKKRAVKGKASGEETALFIFFNEKILEFYSS